MKYALRLSLSAILIAAFAPPAAAQQANNEEFARRQYESGLTFLQNRRYADALKDLQAVVDSFATSTVADNALLQIAQYQLEVARDPALTQGAVDKLLKDYPDTDSAPMAHVLSGRLALAKGRTATDVDTALASFERVSRLFPGSDAVAAAGYYAGETLRVVRRLDEALERFRRVTLEFPRSPWAGRAALGVAYCLVQQDRAQAALQQTQWARQQFPGSPVAADALNLSTIIYRLYVRPPAQPAYGFSGRFIGAERSDYRDVVGITFDPDGRILLGHRGGVATFDAQGAVAGTLAQAEPSAFFVDEQRRIIVAKGGTLIADKLPPLVVSAMTRDNAPRLVDEIPSAVALSNSNRLVADPNGRSVIRIGVDGKYLGVFAAGNIGRLALNELEDVAMLDRSTKAIVLVDRDGKTLGRIPAKGTGYEIEEPIDMAFDTLGHVYVLDRGTGSVLVFGAKNRFLTRISIPEKSPGSFNRPSALAVDTTGRLYIFDERSKRIQVYQ